MTCLSGKCLLQHAKISADMQEQLNSLIHAFEDIMSSSPNDIGYTKVIQIDKETNLNLPCVASKMYTFPLKHQEWVGKELKDLEKTGIIQRSFSPYVSSIVIVPSKCPPVQETKRLCFDYIKLNAQLPTEPENKASGVITLFDLTKIDEMLTGLHNSKFLLA